MKTVAVLRGGVGDEHDVSLKTGMTVLRALDEHPAYRPVDVYIDRHGVWHVRGIPLPPQRALLGMDAVFNALHGAYGEDGGVQRELDRLQIPYTGSGALASALAMNKTMTKQVLERHGIRLPRQVLLEVTPDLEAVVVQVFRSFPQPSVVKPANSGSSVGVTLAESFDQLLQGVKNAFRYAKQVIVEEYVRGREASVGVIDSLRGKSQYDLPAVEIVLPLQCKVFDYQAKYNGSADLRCPAPFDRSVAAALSEQARAVHAALGLRHYSRSDFIVSPRGLYFLEVNTLPGLTDHSLLPLSLHSVGVTLPQFVDHVLDLTMSRT